MRLNLNRHSVGLIWSGSNPVVGLSLTNITRKTAEWSYGSFDASPLFLMASTLIQNNQAQSRVSFIFSTHLGTGHLVRIGTASLSRERPARGLAEVPRFSGKFEADLPGDVGVVQEVQCSEPERW